MNRRTSQSDTHEVTRQVSDEEKQLWKEVRERDRATDYEMQCAEIESKDISGTSWR